MVKKLVFLVVLVGVAVLVWHLFDLGRHLTFYYIQSQQAQWQAWLEQNPLWVALGFFGAFVLVTALSIPAATVLTLLAGSLFGVLVGAVLVSFASTLGASLAFLLARLVGRDHVQRRYADSLRIVNEGIRKDGGLYLFSLRLTPLFPFFLVNILMALTPIPLRQFMWVSQLGMLPATLVYVNAGTQLGRLESVEGILSPALILSLVLLGLLPLLTKKAVEFLRARHLSG